ncbi:MAG: type II secretion system protein, partial [bacterium]|nr:type II secretion system protein [bacterium]
LAEVLITLAIIGVVAAVSIPSVISNSQQQEFKTGLRKAVSVLNSAITMNMALDGESPYDNANLYGFLMKHMSVIESTTSFNKYAVKASNFENDGKINNAAFYTTDGMRFEFINAKWSVNRDWKLYETENVKACGRGMAGDTNFTGGSNGSEVFSICTGCGSLGLNGNSDGTTKPPCVIMVDVNGDRKPNPSNINCKTQECAIENAYKFSDPSGIKLTDLFSIMITDKQAIPYGTAAQKAMYQARK